MQFVFVLLQGVLLVAAVLLAGVYLSPFLWLGVLPAVGYMGSQLGKLQAARIMQQQVWENRDRPLTEGEEPPWQM